MSRIANRRNILYALLAFALVTTFSIALSGTSQHIHAASSNTTKNAFCSLLGKKYQASLGAQMYCFGSQPNGAAKHTLTSNTSFGANVDAANPGEDVSPSGVQAFGQSETSIAANGPYVVEAWNDSTSLLSACGAPMNKEEVTGIGFSSNNGTSFTDLGGLPNSDCANTRYGGDPSIEAFKSGGTSYFYVASLFNPVSATADPRSHIAMAACKATGQGANAVLACSQPIIIASSSICSTFQGFPNCGLLDKDFLSIDPARGLLYASFTELFFDPNTGNTINLVELASCDIGNGALGGTPAAPVCTNDSRGSATSPAAPYLVVAPNDPAGCENEGAYPAVDRATGDVYVAYEHNWSTALTSAGPCASSPVQNVMNFIPASCLTLPVASCSGPAAVNAVNIVSLQGAMIPGYNRFPMNDFPRLAVSDTFGTVSMVWNDARHDLAGDILMQSFSLGSLGAKTSTPVVLNTAKGGWHFLPALRNSNQNGLLTISWYSRGSANTAITNVTAAVDVNPLSAATPAHNTLVTTTPSNWNSVSSDIVPNFGDYTDNYVTATATSPFTGSRVYIAWSDGRLGDPQPFEANTMS